MWKLVLRTTMSPPVDGLEHSVRPAFRKAISMTFWSSAPSTQLPGVHRPSMQTAKHKSKGAVPGKKNVPPLSRWVCVIGAWPPGAGLWWYREGLCFWSSRSRAANSIWHPQLLAEECSQGYLWSLSLRAHLRQIVHSQPCHHVRPGRL